MEIQQLQTSLQKEIDAKQRIHEELKECQAENILKAEYVEIRLILFDLKFIF
jgi:chaperonin cofactor prefoldin